MEIFVRFEAFDSITEPAAIQRLQNEAGEQMQRLEKSGHLVDSRIFADQRGGYVLLDVEDGTHLQDLLGTTMLDHFEIETHPTTSFEDLARLFEESR